MNNEIKGLKDYNVPILTNEFGLLENMLRRYNLPYEHVDELEVLVLLTQHVYEYFDGEITEDRLFKIVWAQSVNFKSMLYDRYWFLSLELVENHVRGFWANMDLEHYLGNEITSFNANTLFFNYRTENGYKSWSSLQLSGCCKVIHCERLMYIPIYFVEMLSLVAKEKIITALFILSSLTKSEKTLEQFIAMGKDLVGCTWKAKRTKIKN